MEPKKKEIDSYVEARCATCGYIIGSDTEEGLRLELCHKTDEPHDLFDVEHFNAALYNGGGQIAL